MEIKRSDGRLPGQMRKVEIRKNFIRTATGSCLFEIGSTRVLCAATVEEKVPLFLRDSGTGWVTAEYGLLPGSTGERVPRGSHLTGRSQEIQRMVGRSLRAVVDLGRLGERTIWIDCDVLEADGGTRTASITGAFIALVQALSRMRQNGLIRLPVLRGFLAAVSVGIVSGRKLLDISYEEDSVASVDFNVVMTDRGRLVEIQGTGEGATFDRSDVLELMDLAWTGITGLISLEREILKDEIPGLLGN